MGAGHGSQANMQPGPQDTFGAGRGEAQFWREVATGVPDVAKKNGNGSAFDRMNVSPLVCFFILGLVFLWPCSAVVRLEMDPVAKYWISPYGSGFPIMTFFVVTIFLFFIAIFVAQVLYHEKTVDNKRYYPLRGNKFIMLSSLLVPCILLFLFANIVLTISFDKSAQLAASDCEDSPLKEKRVLQGHWFAAYEGFLGCITATVKRHPDVLTMGTGFQLYRFQECEEYPVLLGEHQLQWNYLRMLEDTLACSGWCARSSLPGVKGAPAPPQGPPLWTFQGVNDGCALAMSQVFDDKIKYVALQVIVYIIVVLLAGVITLILVAPSMRNMGYGGW